MGAPADPWDDAVFVGSESIEPEPIEPIDHNQNVVAPVDGGAPSFGAPPPVTPSSPSALHLIVGEPRTVRVRAPSGRPPSGGPSGAAASDPSSSDTTAAQGPDLPADDIDLAPFVTAMAADDLVAQLEILLIARGRPEEAEGLKDMTGDALSTRLRNGRRELSDVFGVSGPPTPSPGVTGTHTPSPAVAGTHTSSPGVAGTHTPSHAEKAAACKEQRAPLS